MWIENPWIVFYIKGHLVTLLGGLLIPIDLFPEFLQVIIDYLPFKYYVFFPFKVLIGEVATIEVLKNLGYFLIWIIGLSILTNFTWKKSLNQYTAVGG